MTIPFIKPGDVAKAIPEVLDHLRGGGLLAYPTETVYGLGSLATSERLSDLAALKGRPPRKPFLLLASDRTMAERVGLAFPPAARAMADEFWPGPLTLVLPGGEGRLPDGLRGAEGGIALRVTSHEGMRRLIAQLGEPLTSTSANKPGSSPAPGAAGVLDLFRDEVAAGKLMVLDGGVLGNVPPSTLVDCTSAPPRMIREGAIPRAELRARVGRWAP